MIFSFGPFRLIPKRQLLLLGDHPVKLGGRSFELLHLLVQRSGQIVTKDELIAAAWPTTFVHESNLKVNISGLRRSLGDTQTQPSYVATIAGRGYRFVAPVEINVTDATDAASPVRLPETFGLPLPRDIIGRAPEMASILAELQQRQHVTLVGAGGIGKTTLAVGVARAYEVDCADGVCFVDLSAIDDPALVPAALAAALGMRGHPRDTHAAVLDHLAQRQMLVVLDNCEHVLPAATMFARSFAGRSGMSKLLATSREPLETPAEHVVWIEPLACPDPDDSLTAEQALRSPAIELFARRASEWAGYRFADSDCAAVVRICRALDGLPLAIELVAAKTEHHAVLDLLAMLDQHVSFRNPHGAAPRHETLLATIDWSFRLLSPNEATIFRLVSVFADAFELDDVAALAEAASLKPIQVVAGLGGLVAKSLVTAQVNGDGLSYRLLDTTRRFAIARRQQDPLDAPALHCHARRMLVLLKQSEEECEWRETHDWLNRYRGRVADLRAALAWAFGAGNTPALGIELTAAAIPLWSETSLLLESQRWVALALDVARNTPCDDLLKTKLACSRAWGLFYERKLQNENEETWLDAIAYAQAAGSHDYHMRALLGLSFYLLQIGEIARAITYLEEIGEHCKDRGSWRGAPDSDRALAWAKGHIGEIAESWRVLSQQAAIYAQPDTRTRVAELDIDRFISTRFYLPIIAWLNGHVDYAANAAKAAVEAAADAGHLVSQSNAMGLGALPVALYSGDIDQLTRYTGQMQSILAREHIARWAPVHGYFAAVLRDIDGDRTAVDDMQRYVDELIDCRYVMRIGMYFSHLAEALARQGRYEEAGRTIALALQSQERTGERWCRSELMRVEAAILHDTGQHAAAQGALLRAREEARAIGAISFELRIVNDMATRYLDGDRHRDARDVLQPVYERFGEGFTTHDLSVAAALLQRARIEDSAPQRAVRTSLRPAR